MIINCIFIGFNFNLTFNAIFRCMKKQDMFNLFRRQVYFMLKMLMQFSKRKKPKVHRNVYFLFLKWDHFSVLCVFSAVSVKHVLKILRTCLEYQNTFLWPHYHQHKFRSFKQTASCKIKIHFLHWNLVQKLKLINV